MSSEVSFVEETSNKLLKDLQTWWEIPSTAQYISLFRESFQLPEIEIEDLEKGFIEDTINGPSTWLKDLIYAFLRSILPGRVNPENWEIQLKKLIARKWPANKENPFAEDRAFHQISIRSKVEIVYSLCLYRLDRNDITDVMKSMDADALRVQKLGSDDAGSTYWYFYGTRLYKEEAVEGKKSWDEEWKKQKKQSLKKRGRGRPRKVVVNSEGESDDFDDIDKRNDGYMNVNEKSRWSVVCDTIEEWVNFAEKFKDSKSKEEKSLFQIIQENFLPTLNKIYEEKEKKLQQKIRELMPVREKIVTRRETRKMRGEVIEYPSINGYEISDEAHKVHMIKDRARRLEERNKRASEGESIQRTSRKRGKMSNSSSESEGDIGGESKTTLLQRSDGSSMDLQCQVERLMSSVKLHKDAWPFLYPVNEDDAPAYYDIIKEPVDLSSIESQLFGGSYETIGDLDADFDKMVTNCELYNGEHHAYSVMARTLRKVLRKGLSKILDSLQPEEYNTVDSEGSSDSKYQSSPSSTSPPVEVSEMPSKHKKPSEKNKKQRVMDALELLAHASDLAVQDKFSKRASPPQKSVPVQQIQSLPHHVPSTNMPYHPALTSSSSISKISLPVTSSNFMPVNPFIQGAKKEKTLIIRTKALNAEKQTTSAGNTTSLYTISSTNSNNALPQNNFQTLCTKTVPSVFSGYNQSPNRSNVKVKNNPAVTMQSNVGVPNGVPIVQKVLIPQQIQVSNNGQFVFASPQNTVRLISKEQNIQLQNNMRQLDQNFGKVVPQVVAPGSLMPGLQLQTIPASNTQAFTQVTQSPQFLSIPTFMLSNQNTIHAAQQSSPPSVMNLQPFQLSQRQMHISGQGNT